MPKKTWIEKRNSDKPFLIKKTDKKFADIPEGSAMLIATPRIIDAYVKNIPFGKSSDLKTMREDLALSYDAEKTCPVTTGIFLRIVAEAAYEELQAGKDIDDVAPFWRIITPKMKVAEKLVCGVEFIEKQRILEGIE